jgi:hypothetical protein
LNTPPKIVSAVTLMGNRDLPEIYVQANSLDVDEDSLSLTYRWYINGERMEDQSGSSLDPSLVRRGDEVFAEIVASDGESTSPPFRAVPVTIENHAPEITSLPPTALSADGSYEYRIQAKDADGDPLSYELITAPPGMSLDGQTLVWTRPAAKERAISHNVTIRVSDPHGGEARQEFRFSFGGG